MAKIVKAMQITVARLGNGKYRESDANNASLIEMHLIPFYAHL
jgi:hypothetical protein